MQGMAIRPSVPLQGDGANDMGSLTRHVALRMGSEANLGGDMEGTEADDPLNHSINPRHVLRTSSMSPSSESPLRRPVYNQHMVMFTNYYDLYHVAKYLSMLFTPALISSYFFYILLISDYHDCFFIGFC